MNKAKYYFIHITLLSMAIAWLILGIVILIYLDGGDPNNQTYKIFLNIFIILSFLEILGLVLSVTTKTGKEYWKTYSKREFSRLFIKRKKQHIDELKKNDYSILKEYNGKNAFVVRSLVFLWIMAVLHIILTAVFIIWGFIDKEYIILPIWGLYLVAMMAGAREYLSIKAKIDDVGVSLIKKGKVIKTHKWSKIKTIGISLNSFGYSSAFSFMYISSRTLKGEPLFDQYVEKNYLILIRTRPKVIHCILKYWDGEIKNLDTQKSWLKYINKL